MVLEFVSTSTIVPLPKTTCELQGHPRCLSDSRFVSDSARYGYQVSPASARVIIQVMKVPGPDLTASPQLPAPSYLAFAYSFDCGS